MIKIAENTQVRLHFSLGLENGDLIDETQAPAEFKVGDGQLLPNFEALLKGLKAGDKRSFLVENGFGEVNDNNVHWFKRSQFEESLEAGVVVNFSGPSGDLPGVVKGFSEGKGDMVEVDFNHPLAAKTIVFTVEILDVVQLGDDAVSAVKLHL